MTTESKAVDNCTNCGRPIGEGGAGGLDARCYQYKRRHGGLPPAELELAGDKTERLVLRLEPALLRLVELGAKREGCTVTEWTRRALRKRGEALKLTRLETRAVEKLRAQSAAQ